MRHATLSSLLGYLDRPKRCLGFEKMTSANLHAQMCVHVKKKEAYDSVFGSFSGVKVVSVRDTWSRLKLCRPSILECHVSGLSGRCSAEGRLGSGLKLGEKAGDM